MKTTFLRAARKSMVPLALLALNAAAGTLYVDITSTNPLSPFSDWTTAATNIQDALDVAAVGDEVVVTNGVYATGGRIVYGSMSNRVAVTKPITLRSANGPSVTAIVGCKTSNALAVRCVYLTNGASVLGFTLTNGAAKATGDYDREQSGGGVWCELDSSGCVSNCVLGGNTAYRGGGSFQAALLNCTLINNSARYGAGAYVGNLSNCLLEANVAGAWGGGARRCSLYNCILIENSTTEYASGGAGAQASTLVNCTLSGNTATGLNCFGGGASDSTLLNCSLVSNSATATNGSGGGAYGGTLTNCILIGNQAGQGGGAYDATLDNCTLCGNSATNAGGGVHSGVLANCIVYYNAAEIWGDNYDNGSNLSCCCTFPLPTTGVDSFTNAPLFVGAPVGNFRLQSNSPCINAGNNGCASPGTDFDGNPRISGGTVDVGAYEFQNPASAISCAWLQRYGLAVDGTADTADSDLDGLNNWQEWRAGTDPTNGVSVLQMLAPTYGASGVTVTWQSVTNRSYYLQRSLDLSAQSPFLNVRSNIVGQAGTTTYIDTNSVGAGLFFYRVGVQ
jgi:hypothetical protein